jgi:hypothetical protein
MDRNSSDTSTIETSLNNISALLQTGLNKRTTKVVIELIESGIDPGAIADVILELRQTPPAHIVSVNNTT